jgi:cyclophilin family peptidyl-prolyl cis-trans isomerase
MQFAVFSARTPVAISQTLRGKLLAKIFNHHSPKTAEEFSSGIFLETVLHKVSLTFYITEH